MRFSSLVLVLVCIYTPVVNSWDAGPSQCKHSECNGGVESETILDTQPKWANSDLPGRLADCPATYTHNGLTCGRGSDDIHHSSKVANCPSGYTNMGLTCYRGPHSYTKGCTTIFGKYHCNSGYTDMGCHCQRWAHSMSSSSMTCPDGYFLNKNLGRCYYNCPSGYTNTGEYCHRPVSTLGTSSMTCKADEEKGGIDGERCYPKNGLCWSDREYYGGLCYKKCPTNSERTAVSTCKHTVRSRGNTHLFIVNRAIELLEPTHPEIAKTLKEGTCNTQWMDGLWDEDESGNSDSPYSDTQGAHFYNAALLDWEKDVTDLRTYHVPAYSEDPSTNANNVGNEFLNEWKETKQGTVSTDCTALGRSLHYITDVTMPFHTNGMSGLQGFALLHPYVEAYVPFIQDRYHPTEPWKDDYPGLGSVKVFEQTSRQTNQDGEPLMKAVLSDSDGTVCTIDNSVAPLAYIGYCFVNRPEVDEAIGDVLKRAPHFVASWLVEAFNEFDAGTVSIIEDGNCVSGEKQVEKVVQEGSQMTPVKELVIGDVIMGVDENLQPSECTVTALGKYKKMKMYDGYTADHPVFSEEENGIVLYGKHGEETKEDSYDVLTDCPLAQDQDGVLFSGFGHCGKGKLSWSNYLTLYDAVSTLVESSASEIDWFSPDTYVDMNHIVEQAEELCDLVLECDAQDAEDAAACVALDNYTGELLEKEVKASKKDAAKTRKPKASDLLKKTRGRKEKNGKKEEGNEKKEGEKGKKGKKEGETRKNLRKA